MILSSSLYKKVYLIIVLILVLVLIYSIVFMDTQIFADSCNFTVMVTSLKGKSIYNIIDSGSILTSVQQIAWCDGNETFIVEYFT